MGGSRVRTFAGAIASCLLAAVVWSPSSAGTISTYAGTGTGGYNADGIAATASHLQNPTEMAVDVVGNLFFADTNNHRIRRVDAATGVITTIAGTGTKGYNADSIPATNAELNEPWGIAVDAAGNVYIGDMGNDRVRRVDAVTGTITTIAGKGTKGYSGDGMLAINAELNEPRSLTFDGAGDLYIADTYNHCVRKVLMPGGTISTVAGVGTVPGYNGEGVATSARLWIPYAVHWTPTGFLLIADSMNQRIRAVNLGTGNISTVAGTGAPGYNGDGIVAAAAQVNFPLGVSTDTTGSIVIADTNNHRIRRIEIGTGLIETVAGTGTAVYNGDGILATEACLNAPARLKFIGNGEFYIADTYGNRVRKVVPQDPVDVAEPDAGLLLVRPNVLDRVRTPNGITFDVSGDANGNVTLKIFSTSGVHYGTLDIVLDASGKGQGTYTIDGIDDMTPGHGSYWAVAEGGGVNDKKMFFVISERE